MSNANLQTKRQLRAANAQSHVMGGKRKDSRPERAVVVTDTLMFEALAALTTLLAGTLQVAPVGAPVQVNVAIPPTPWPPIVRE